MIRVAKQAVKRDLVHEALLREGFVRTSDPPSQEPYRSTAWSKGAGRIYYITSASTGVAMFVLQDGETEMLAAAVERIAPTLGVVQWANALSANASSGDRAVFALAFAEVGLRLRFDKTANRADMVAPIVRLLGDEVPLVANAALEAAFDLLWPEIEEAVLDLARRREDLAWASDHWKRLRDAAAANERKEAEARAKMEREAALSDLVDAKRWDEALAGALAVFAEKKDETPGRVWRARSLALIGLGRLWEGAIFAGGWLATQKEGSDGEREARAVLAEVGPRLPDDETDLTKLVIEIKDLSSHDRVREAFLPVVDVAKQRTGELGFLAAVIEIRLSYSAAAQQAASTYAERAVQAFPKHVASHCLLGQTHIAGDRVEQAVAAYRTALALAKEARTETPREALLSRFDRKLDYSDEAALTLAQVHRRLLGALVKAGADAFIPEAEALDAMDLEPALREELFLFRATSATELKLHERAVGWYRAAIAAEQGEPSDTARFNLACELSKTGQHEAALPMLEQAIALRSEFADDARTDDYFEAIWDTVPFIRVVAQWEEPPTTETVERSLQRALGMSYRGEGEDALAEAHRAVAGAAALGDDQLLARALERLGSVHTYETSPARGVALLERAVELGEKALAKEPQRFAAMLHALGAALHAAGRFDDAEKRYREALELRKSALGPEDETIGISLGDLARLASSRGRLDEAEQLMSDTVALLEKVVARTEGEDQWDALVNLALVQGNRVGGAVSRKRPFEEVLACAEEAADRLEAIVQAGARVPSGAIPRLRKSLAGCLDEQLAPDVAGRLGQLAGRLLALEEPDPAVRAERLYWAGLKQGARELIAAGATDVEIAHAIRRAVRGEPQGAPTQDHPAFANLNIEIANRLSATTDLVMVAMALDLAISGHQSIVDVLGELEGFAIANAQGVGGDEGLDEDDDLDDDDDLDEDEDD